LRVVSRGFEADGADEGVEIVDDALIEAIELGSPLGFEPGICFDGTEKACCEWARRVRRASGRRGQIEYPCGRSW